MKRIVFAMLAAVLVLAGCGEAKTVEVIKEVPVEKIVEKVVDPVTIQWMTEEAICPKGVEFTGPACAAWYAKQYEGTHPGVKIQVTMVAPLDGTTQQTDAYILAGLNPNSLTGYAGRIGKYRNYALGLPYDPAKWQHPAIDGWVRDGKLVMYPYYAWAVTLQVNYTYAKELGIDNLLPKLDGERTWTTEQYLQFAEACKAKGVKAGMVFCQPGNGSGDYTTDMWALGFGAKLYGSDYSAMAVNSPQWAEAWTFLKKLVDSGAFVPNPWALNDDSMNEAAAKRGILTMGQERAIQLPSGDELRLVSYPSPKGSFVPFATAPTGLMVFDNAKRLKALGGSAAAIAKAEKEAEAAVAFSQWLIEGDYTKMMVQYRGWTWRTDLKSSPPQTSDKDSPRYREMLAEDFAWMQRMASQYGLNDLGTANPLYQQVRLLKVQALADVLQGKAAPEAALSKLADEYLKLK